MTSEELQRLVEKVSLDSFGKPFYHQAIFNARLKTTGGRYHLNDHHLDFNPKMLVHGEDVLIGIIKHELCHYHLHLEGKGYQHQDASFKELLMQTGGLCFAPRVSQEVKVIIYHCQTCGKSLQRRRKINTQRYVCASCHGKLTYVETRVLSLGK